MIILCIINNNNFLQSKYKLSVKKMQKAVTDKYTASNLILKEK